MHDHLKPYKILVIDDFSQFRQTIISMLKRLGTIDVDQAANGVDAVAMCEQKAYDIILCDYNLGEGQDGQQVLEELIVRSLIQRGVMFIMITAEMTSAQVMGAIEYSPDSYLAKPFNFEQLEKRLSRIIAKNQRLKGIYHNINIGEFEVALEGCDEMIKNSPQLRLSCLKLKTIILEQLQKFEEASKIYQEVNKEHSVLWAMLGFGKYLYSNERYQEALDQFEKTERDFPRQVHVLDWQGKCHRALNQIPEAEQVILKAIDISPKSLSRQAVLGDLAESLDHYDIAYKAYSRTVKEGEYSCLIRPEHYHRLFDNARNLINEVASSQRRHIVKSTELVSKVMESKYLDDPVAMAGNMASLANFYSTVGKKDQVGRCLNQLNKSLDNPDCEISEGDFGYIQDNIEKLKSISPDADQLSDIDNHLDGMRQRIEIEKQNNEKAIELTEQGLILIQKGQKTEALDVFREVLTYNTVDSSYLFNPAQLILLDVDMKQDTELRKEAKKYLGAIKLEQHDKRKALYVLLKSKVAND